LPASQWLRSRKTVGNEEQANHSEMQVAKSSLLHHPGSLASVAAKLGEAEINIIYTYAVIEPERDTPVVIFGVAEVGGKPKRSRLGFFVCVLPVAKYSGSGIPRFTCLLAEMKEAAWWAGLALMLTAVVH
jgi:hypothetical protein